MAALIEVDPQIWLGKYRESEAARFGASPHLDSNLFFSFQFTGRDESRKDLKAWALHHQGIQIAWMATLWNSADTIRFRGILVQSEFRNQGHGRKLISSVMQQFPDARRFLLFCAESSVPYYRRSGFEVLSGFQYRPVETYNAATNSYEVICAESLVLMAKT